MTTMAEREFTDLGVIHCSDTKPSMDHVNEDEIRQWHLDRGWSDAGYNIVIPRRPTDHRHGYIEIARPLDQRGAHVKGFNHRAIGICLVGGMSETGEPEDNFTKQQWDALRNACEFVWEYAPLVKFCGHYDLDSGKTCPNFDAIAWAQSEGFPAYGY